MKENNTIFHSDIIEPEIQGIYRSDEEFYFACYLEELRAAGYVLSYDYEPETYRLVDTVKMPFKEQLKTKIKESDVTLLRPVEYTPDFNIVWKDEAAGVFIPMSEFNCRYVPFQNSELELQLYTDVFKDNFSPAHSIIEVKPFFDFKRANQQAIKMIKWLYAIQGPFVQMVKIGDQKKDIFAKTFLPERAKYTVKSGKQRTKNGKPIEGRTLQEFVDLQKTTKTKFW